MRMRAGAVAATATAAVVLVGCAPLVKACPDIGWINTVTVQLEGDDNALARVAEVQLCDEVGCSAPLLSTPLPLEPLTTVPPGVDVDDPSTWPQPTSVPGGPLYYNAYASGRDSWMVDVGMSAPETAEVRAFDAQGAVLGEVSATLQWVRVGGSAECGGPMQADPVVLPIAPPAP
ncbi:hypothetical protein [Cnuibacter physcomitrellae]|nr:hypothetical protein [Cnuibacter physcomitrellae]